MATNPPPDLVLTPTTGAGRPIKGWLTVFHLFVVAVDPGNERSAWLVPTAARILTNFDQADCRVAWLVAGLAEDARRLLGRWAKDILTFVDPDLTAIKAFGLESLPSAVHLGMDGQIVNVAEGWDPPCMAQAHPGAGPHRELESPRHPRPPRPGPFQGRAATEDLRDAAAGEGGYRRPPPRRGVRRPRAGAPWPERRSTPAPRG